MESWEDNTWHKATDHTLLTLTITASKVITAAKAANAYDRMDKSRVVTLRKLWAWERSLLGWLLVYSFCSRMGMPCHLALLSLSCSKPSGSYNTNRCNLTYRTQWHKRCFASLHEADFLFLFELQVDVKFQQREKKLKASLYSSNKRGLAQSHSGQTYCRAQSCGPALKTNQATLRDPPPWIFSSTFSFMIWSNSMCMWEKHFLGQS